MNQNIINNVKITIECGTSLVALANREAAPTNSYHKGVITMYFILLNM